MRRQKFQAFKQPTPKELTDVCLEFLRRKFYTEPGDDKKFQQDRRLLLSWVVLWPASWLNSRGVTLHGDAYREIFMQVFMQASAHLQSKVKYRPAYLRQVIQSHFKIHGEEYYDQAKSVRRMAEHALMVAGQARQIAPDPIKEMASARAILGALKPKKTASQGGVKSQLNLFG
jgi:hypothetical protein